MVENKMNLQGLRVLCIEDNEQDAEKFLKLLENSGCVCDLVPGSDEALGKIMKEQYDIIFVDYMMSEEDGITVLCKIHNTHRCDNVPAVIVTAGSAGVAKQNYLNAGFSAYLGKPITKEKLQNVIEQCVNCESDSEATHSQRSRILVVDDDEMNLFIAKRILSARFDVDTVSSGRAALAHLENTKVDLILLDLRMPQMDGFEFMSLAKEDPILREIPIICLTADDEQESEVKCFELGAVDFIAKPFVAEIMFQRTTRIIELRRLQKELQNEVEKKTLSLNIRSRQLKRLTAQVMETLAGTIDAKDKYTNGHSLRVAEYSRMLAAKMNLPLDEQEDIYYFGLLHDIGKIGIPDEIINKTSKLTDEEYEIIKTHPVIGSEILEKMSELPGIVFGARWHHERYDGKGYPDGLTGENIPLVARIIGVADAYDAMSSKRSYRDILPQNYIRGEIEKCAGTQFDPKVAAFMLEIIDEDTEYRLREW